MILFLFFLDFSFSFRAQNSSKVAVVGGGISGTAAAFYLHELNPNVEIHIFDKNSSFGGRELTIDFEGLALDVGATAIFSKNYYLLDFMKKFNISQDNSDDGTDVLGIWSGTEFHFISPTDFRLAVNILKEYGTSTLKLFSDVRNTLDRFLTVYDFQRNGTFWTSPIDLAKAIGIYDMTQTSSYSHYEKLGMNKNFILDFIDGASRDNYNQNGNINAFVDTVSLAGAGIGGNVFTLVKGTQQIPHALAEYSLAHMHLDTIVNYVSNANDKKFTVSTNDGDMIFDAVVLATPAEITSMNLDNFPSLVQCKRQFQKVFVTFVSGTLNGSYFGNPSRMPTDVLTISNASSPFTTIGYHGKTSSGKHVYKLFSLAEMKDEDLSSIFDGMEVIYRHLWDAYPMLNPTSCWSPFVPQEGFVYVNAMESMVSCMETEIISAKNAALYINDLLQ